LSITQKLGEKAIFQGALKFLQWALLLVCLSFIGLYLFTVLRRLTYPYELEWMEGTMLTHSIRLLEGKPLFSPPSADFISALYTPFYHLVVAGLMKILGVHLWVGRLVSILASLLTASLLYRIMRRENHNYLVALITSGLFLSSYRFAGAWMDIVQVDALQLSLLLLGFYLLRYYTTALWGVVLAAGVFSLAYFTKQSAPIFIAAAGLALFGEDRKKAFLFLSTCALLIGGTILISNYFTNNWFWFYTHSIMLDNTQYSFTPHIFLHSFLKDILRNIPFLLLLIVAWYGYQVSKPHQDKLPLFWTLAFAAGFVSSMLMRSKGGGYTNSYLTLCCFGSILVGMILGKSNRFKPWLRALVMLILLLQFYRFGYNPLNQMPSRADYRAGDMLISKIASFPGPVLVVSHPFYPVMAGKKMNMQDMAMRDLLDSGHPIPEDLSNKIQHGYYSAVILDEFDDGYEKRHPLRPLIEEAYYLAEELFAPGDNSFYPITGYGARPNYLYLPKDKG